MKAVGLVNMKRAAVPVELTTIGMIVQATVTAVPLSIVA
jgi:hypothetical protein